MTVHPSLINKRFLQSNTLNVQKRRHKRRRTQPDNNDDDEQKQNYNGQKESNNSDSIQQLVPSIYNY